MEEVATKVTQMISRPDGSVVKIVAESMYGIGLHRSVNVLVFRKKDAQSDWQLCSDRPAEGWRDMPLSDYVKHGRSEALRTVTHGEIFKVTGLLGKPLDSSLFKEQQ